MKKESKQYKGQTDEIVDSNILREPGVSYNANPVANGINNWVILNGATQKPESRLTSFEKIAIIKEGICKTDLEHLKQKADLDYNQLAVILSVARATLINKKGKEKFDVSLSEKIEVWPIFTHTDTRFLTSSLPYWLSNKS